MESFSKTVLAVVVGILICLLAGWGIKSCMGAQEEKRLKQERETEIIRKMANENVDSMIKQCEWFNQSEYPPTEIVEDE